MNTSDSQKKQLVLVTDAASNQIITLLKKEQDGAGLRLGISGGGCSGLMYKLDFTAEQDGDTVVDYGTFKLLLDKKSTIYLGGVTLDYQGGLEGKGFVIQNPQASNTCGCGESFAL
jgi:iron-sulfur cluster assembly protein